MNWILFFEYIRSFLIGLIFILFISRFVRVYWPVCFDYITGRHRKTLQYLNSLSATNLKPKYIFFDHAIDEYDLSLSYLEYDISHNYIIPYNNITTDELWYKELVCNTHNLLLKSGVDISNIISQISKTIHLPNNYSEKRIGVSYFAHNRDQRTEKDESHWFRIELFTTNLYTQTLLSTFAKDIQSLCKSIDQPQILNMIYPLILGLSISINIYFKYNNKYYVIINNQKHILDNIIKTDIEYEDIIKWEKEHKEDLYYQCKSPRHQTSINGSYIATKIEYIYTKLYNYSIIRMKYTDIGLDTPSNILRIFGQIYIEAPNKIEIGSLIKNKQCYPIDDIYCADLQKQLTIQLKYSWINLQCKLKNNNVECYE